MSRTITQISQALADLNTRQQLVTAEMRPLGEKAKAKTITAGELERYKNLGAHAKKLLDEREAIQAEFRGLYDSGAVVGENGDGANPDPLAVPHARGGHALHPWTQASLAARNGLSLRDRGTHSVPVPVVGGILNAWPTDPLRETDADKVPHPMPRRVRYVADLLATRPVTEDGVSYIRQTARTNNAAPVARHGAKPQSVYELTRVEDRTRTIAHVSEPVALQDLQDNANLDTFVESELVLGLRLGLDAQIVDGDGTGENMSGLLTLVTATEAFDTNLIKTARQAITSLEITDVEATAFLMAPEAWESLELLQSADGIFLLPDSKSPVDRARRQLWGVPVVVTPAMAITDPLLVGDFSGARLAVRDPGQIDWATAGTVFDDPEYHDLFDNNEAKARAEMRAVLEVTSLPRFRKVAVS